MAPRNFRISQASFLCVLVALIPYMRANPTVACDPASNSLFDLGTTTVTCTATDDAGNDATATFTVTVNLDTPPPPDTDLTGTFGRPLGDAVPALVGHAGRTIPLKLDVRDGSTLETAADIGAPTLYAARLAGCAVDAPAQSETPAGTFDWSNGTWQMNLDTSGLGSGCVRLTASSGGDVITTAVVQLVPDTATPARAKGKK